MKFVKYFPTVRLRPFVKYFAISEDEVGRSYKVFPSSGLVMGFLYRGQLAAIHGNAENHLASAGITGIAGTYKVFKNSAGIGTVLVYLTETGFAHFAPHPAHELFNVSLSLDVVFDRGKVREVEGKLAFALTDLQRIGAVERFLLSELKDVAADKLIAEAVRHIQDSKGKIRIRELARTVGISESPLEKRFRQLVGTTPKKFASIIRFNAVLDKLNNGRPLMEICYESDYFDQAHFIKSFKKFTGDTLENFKQSL